MTSFGTKLRGIEKLAALTDKLQNGQAAYADAYEYALEVGTALSDTFSEELSSDVLPDGKMYFNIANRVVRDPLTRAYRLIADECEGVQTELNTAAGIGLKAQRPDYPESRIKGFVDRLSSEPDYDKVSWILKEPVKTFSESIVDDSVKKNAEMHYNAGLSPQIIRTAAAGCCEWCTAVEGTYPYPNIPKDIYRRHNFCRCQVEYDPKTGRRQDVHTRRWSDEKGYVRYREIEELRRGMYNKEGDPLFDALGSIEKSHPEVMHKIITEAKSLGVEVRHHKGAIAYAPGLKTGSAGQLLINSKDSYGAWLHERKHMLDDYHDGWGGFKGLVDIDRRSRMEYDAYKIEIRIAREIGREDIANELIEACRKEIEMIGGKWDADRLS